MKRKANYNVKHKPGGGAYKNNIPEKKRNPLLRPIQRPNNAGPPDGPPNWLTIRWNCFASQGFVW